jgi:hypothetical protein
MSRVASSANCTHRRTQPRSDEEPCVFHTPPHVRLGYDINSNRMQAGRLHCYLLHRLSQLSIRQLGRRDPRERFHGVFDGRGRFGPGRSRWRRNVHCDYPPSAGGDGAKLTSRLLDHDVYRGPNRGA